MMLKFDKPIWENLEQAINFYCNNELESFKSSEYFLRLTQLVEALGLKVECSFGFAPDNKKYIYLYFDIIDDKGNLICANNDEFDALGYSTCIVSIDRKNRFKFYSWQDDEDWIDSVKWNINELVKMSEAPVFIKNIQHYDKFSGEADIIVSDGKFDLLCYYFPTKKNFLGTKVERISSLFAKNIMRVTDKECFTQKSKDHFAYHLCGEVIDTDKPLIRIGKMIIELDYPLPKDIEKGEYVEFEVERLDCEIE